MLVCLALLSLLTFPAAIAQNTSPPRIEVVIPATPREGVFTIAPNTSFTGTIQMMGAPEPSTVKPKLKAWMATEEALNGLKTQGLKPWHAIISYEKLFDRGGDHAHSGTIDELWSGSKQYRIKYESDNLHQTDIATETGLYRIGDQRWPTPAESDARTDALEPFTYAASLLGYDTHPMQITSGSYTLDCTALTRGKAPSIGDMQYCFDPTTHALRYSHTSSWTQTAYNAVTSFQGRYIARDVVVTDGGHPSITLHITKLETLPEVDTTAFTPPPGATLISAQRLTGVRLKPTHTEFPQWPSGIGENSFKVTVEIVVGKDGHPLSAHAVSGPEKARKAAEKDAMNWRFEPYLVLGEPSEVETKIELSQN